MSELPTADPKLTPEQKLKLVEGRIRWILNDAAYKAPEQMLECWIERWEPHLRLVLVELYDGEC